MEDVEMEHLRMFGFLLLLDCLDPFVLQEYPVRQKVFLRLPPKKNRVPDWSTRVESKQKNNSYQLIQYVVYPIIYKVLYIQTVVVWDF